jgi:hypothetical protein
MHINGIFVDNIKIQYYNYPIKSKAGHFFFFLLGLSVSKNDSKSLTRLFYR